MPFLDPGPGQAALLSPCWTLAPLWESLALSGRHADPFCSGPAWQLAAHEVFAPERRLYYAASGSGLLVLAVQQTGAGPILTPLEDGWLFGATLLGPDAVNLLAQATRDFRAEYGSEAAVYLSGMRPDANPDLIRGLAAEFGPSRNFFFHSASLQCMASLAGGLDGFLSRRSPHRRARLRALMRKAPAAGVDFERRLPAPEEVDALYARMLAVEEKSWKGAGHCGMAEKPAREFYAALLLRLARRGQARVIMASIEGEDVGFIFGGVLAGGECGPYYRGQQFSFDQRRRRLGLGNMLQLAMIGWLCEEGVARYDLGPISGERMGYKSHWAEEKRRAETWLMLVK